MSKSLDGNTECTCESEIGDFQVARSINQKILRLQIPMDNSARVAVIDSIDELVEEELDLVGSDGVLVLG